MSSQIKLDHIGVAIKDLERGRAAYERLGFKREASSDNRWHRDATLARLFDAAPFELREAVPVTVNRLVAQAKAHPGHFICGCPVYDESVPKGRLYGRYATHVWVWINTLSFAVKDSMCGFRVYPLAPTVARLERTRIGRRMDFDVEIAVRHRAAEDGADDDPERQVATEIIHGTPASDEKL